MRNRLHTIARDMVVWLRKRWKSARVYLKLIGPCWFAIATTLGLVALTLHPQTVDAMAQFAEDRGFFSQRHLMVLITLLIYSISIWYICRVMLYVRYPDRPRNLSHRHIQFVIWLPRLVGGLPILAASGAFLMSRKFFFVLLYLGLAALFIYVLHVRRKALELRQGAPEGADSVLLVHAKSRPPRVSRIVVAAALIAAAAALVVLLISPVTVPQLIGPLGVVYIAGAVWAIVASSLLIYPSRRFRLPSLFTILLLLAIVFGLWNDNHSIDTDPTTRTGVRNRPMLAEHFEDWLEIRGVSRNCQGRACSNPDRADAPFPVFVVSAEGGGIRAAYWTAAVLNAITSEAPRFPCHLFAVSGVSGGSLGAAAYAARISEAFAFAGEPKALCQINGAPSAARFLEENGEIDAELQALGNDFLSPVLAGMLFPDLIQRFLPVAILPDRASYLEKSWEVAWASAWEAELGKSEAARSHAVHHPFWRQSNAFEEDFLGLWSGHLGLLTPSLFLNATRVETGQRAIVSNIRLNEYDAHDEGLGGDFGFAYDLLERMGSSVKLSKAVHFSARFTYLSPAATIQDSTSGKSSRIVDGGYFENSGVATTSEVVDALDGLCGSREGQWNCSVHVLVISNDVSNPNAWQEGQAAYIRGNAQDTCDCDESPGQCLEGIRRKPYPSAQEPTSARFLAETLSPLRTLFATRSARGYLAEEQLFRQRPCSIHRAQLEEIEGRTIPLGWILSDKVRTSIADQARSLPTVPFVAEIISKSHVTQGQSSTVFPHTIQRIPRG